MPKVRTTYAYKIQSIVKKFSDKFMESINIQLYLKLKLPMHNNTYVITS